MKNILWAGLALVTLIVAVALPSLAQTPKLSTPASIDVKALQEMTRSGKVTLINVSALLVCTDAKIPGSLCLSCDDEKDSSVLSSLAKDSKIVFYSGSKPVDSDCNLVKQAVAFLGSSSVYILDGELPAWRRAGYPTVTEKRIVRVPSRAVNPAKFPAWLRQTKKPLVIDIRSAKAYAAGHLESALNFPLTRLHIQYADIPFDRTLLIVDDDGTQSFLAASYLTGKGFLNTSRLNGGMANYRRSTR